MPAANPSRTPSLLPDEETQHLIVLAAFTAYIMHTSGCNQQEATKRTAALCALAQQALEIK